MAVNMPGIHLPPSARAFTAEEMAATKRLQPRHLVALLFRRGVVPEQADQLLELVSETGAMLIARIYEPAPIAHWQPLDWGYEAAERVGQLLPIVSRVVLDNEPNLPEEGGVTDPGRLDDFWTASAAGIRDALGSACPELLLPPLAPAGEYWRIYRDIHRRGTTAVFERAACHIYARVGNWADARRLADLTYARVDVTEWDSWTPEGYLPVGECLELMAGPDVDATAWFALSGDDPAFEPYYLLRHWGEVFRMMPEYLYGFRELADRLGLEVVGEPVEDEHYFPDGKTSLQQTTRGLMVYSKDANQPLFLPAQLPNS